MDPHVRSFNKELNALLKMLESKARGDNEIGLVAGVQNKLTLARAASYEHVVLVGVDTFFKYNDDITKRNEDLLLSGDASELLSASANDDAKLYAELINLVRRIYKRSNATDRDAAWKHLEQLRDDCIAYKLSTLRT